MVKITYTVIQSVLKEHNLALTLDQSAVVITAWKSLQCRFEAPPATHQEILVFSTAPIFIIFHCPQKLIVVEVVTSRSHCFKGLCSLQELIPEGLVPHNRCGARSSPQCTAIQGLVNRAELRWDINVFLG